MKTIIASGLFLASTLICIAQASNKKAFEEKIFEEPCGTMYALKLQKENNPDVINKMLAVEAHIDKVLKNKAASKSQVKDVITIPVIFHVLYKTASENLTESRILSQLDVLNEDFRMMNENASATLDVFKDRAADLEIEFCLAQEDPEGLPTTGIQRIATTLDEFTIMEQEIKFTDLGGADAWPRDEYLNIWIGDLEPGLLGYAQFPGQEASTDGVVINYINAGRAGAPPGISGRTATHEVGHWVNLRHVWGDGDCNMDDGVDDTPPAAASHSGCSLSADSCTGDDEPDMIQNYMDYSDDDCLTLFTKGQKEITDAVFAEGGPRAALRNSTKCIPPILADDDARFIEVINPIANQNFCTDALTPKVRFRNFGNKTLNVLKIEAFVDGDLIDTFVWNGSVETGAYGETDLNILKLSQGAHELKFVIAGVNSGPDDKPEDNEISVAVQVLGGQLPFEEGFEESNFPPTLSNINDVDGDNEGFQLKTGVAHTGNNCMYINCFDYGLNGAIDEFVLPLIDLSKTGNPMLEFYNAYARYSSDDSDTLEVLVSKDCGQTFKSVFKKEGVFIATVGTRLESYQPASANEWRQRIVDLKEFEGESEVAVKFRCINSHEQNLYIDDIKIFGDSMIDVNDDFWDSLNVQIYPNPVVDNLYIQLKQTNAFKGYVTLNSINGKELLQKPIDNNSLYQKVKMQSLPNGIYVINISANGFTYSKKIIKME